MRDESASRFLTVILLIIAAFVAFVIASGTVWACVRTSGTAASPSGKRLFSSKTDSAAIESALNAGSSPDASPEAALFSDVGPLRASTADGNGTVIVIQPYFPYPSDDIAFREELVKKTRTVRAGILDWFASRTVVEIRRLGETGVKQAILDVVNGVLVLGKLDTVWFSEFMVLD